MNYIKGYDNYTGSITATSKTEVLPNDYTLPLTVAHFCNRKKDNNNQY